MGFVAVEGCSVGGGGRAGSSTCVDGDVESGDVESRGVESGNVESGDGADADAGIDDGCNALVVGIISSIAADSSSNRSSGIALVPCTSSIDEVVAIFYSSVMPKAV